jgi:predicted amidohydrolase
MKNRIKLVLAQISCKRGDKQRNLQRMEEVLLEAKKQSSDLVIFPELCVTGYANRDQFYELAETIPGPSAEKIEEFARQNDLHVIFGMPELSGKTKGTLYNTAAMIGPEGLIGKYRKMHLPTHSVFEEKRYFRLGYQAAAFETALGTVGLCICYDIFFPELIRLIRLKGAQLIVCISASPAVRKEYFEILTAARAIENTAYLAYVNLAGVEEGLQFWGGSRLIGPTGTVIAKAKYDEPDLVFCELDLRDLRPAEAFIPTLRDLRPELFDKLKLESEKI